MSAPRYINLKQGRLVICINTNSEYTYMDFKPIRLYRCQLDKYDKDGYPYLISNLKERQCTGKIDNPSYENFSWVSKIEFKKSFKFMGHRKSDTKRIRKFQKSTKIEDNQRKSEVNK